MTAAPAYYGEWTNATNPLMDGRDYSSRVNDTSWSLKQVAASLVLPFVATSFDADFVDQHHNAPNLQVDAEYQTKNADNATFSHLMPAVIDTSTKFVTARGDLFELYSQIQTYLQENGSMEGAPEYLPSEDVIRDAAMLLDEWSLHLGEPEVEVCDDGLLMLTLYNADGFIKASVDVLPDHKAAFASPRIYGSDFSCMVNLENKGEIAAAFRRI